MPRPLPQDVFTTESVLRVVGHANGMFAVKSCGLRTPRGVISGYAGRGGLARMQKSQRHLLA